MTFLDTCDNFKHRLENLLRAFTNHLNLSFYHKIINIRHSYFVKNIQLKKFSLSSFTCKYTKVSASILIHRRYNSNISGVISNKKRKAKQNYEPQLRIKMLIFILHNLRAISFIFIHTHTHTPFIPILPYTYVSVTNYTRKQNAKKNVTIERFK